MSALAERVSERFANFSIVERLGHTKEYTPEDVVDLFSNDLDNQHYLLPQTGFDVSAQVSSFSKLEDDFETRKNRIIQDIQHFKWEYIDQQPVLHNPIQIKNHQVVSIGYGEVPMTSYINKNERNGASYQEAEIVSTWLPMAQNGSIFLSTSPKGPSGIRDQQGNWINHPESQTKIYHKDENGFLHAYTLRTSLTIEENIALLQKVSGKDEICDGEYNSEYEAICDVAATVVMTRNHSPEDIVNMLGDITNQSIIWNKKEASATVEQMQVALKKAKGQTVTDARVEKIINKFSKKLNKYQGKLNDKQIKELSILIGSTVIEVHDALRGKSTDTKDSVSRISELGGCAGGGTPYEMKSGKVIIENGKRYLECYCPICDKSKSKGKIKALISNGKISCPRCKSSANYKC